MITKFLDLNIFKGKFLPQVIDFIKQENFDIMQMQEVTKGKYSFDGVDVFEEIKKIGYLGELAAAWNLQGDKNSYMGNAVFFKPGLKLEDKKIIWLKNYREIPEKGYPIQKFPRCALSLQINGIRFINTHLAWGPDPKDKKFKLAQAEKLIDYISQLKIPFVLSGDFNVTPDSQIVKRLNGLAVNLTVNNSAPTTLNPRTHKAKDLFPPGISVDYIYVSRDLKTKNFRVINDIDLSDHLGLMVEIKM